jgi:hypothetical protein
MPDAAPVTAAILPSSSLAMEHHSAEAGSIAIPGEQAKRSLRKLAWRRPPGLPLQHFPK